MPVGFIPEARAVIIITYHVFNSLPHQVMAHVCCTHAGGSYIENQNLH